MLTPQRNFFRPQRAKPKPTAARDTATAEVTIAPVDATSESFLVLAVMPFTPDYFQVHASTCSIMRDVYKKLLAMVLPPTRAGTSRAELAPTLLHNGTLLMMGPADGSAPATDLATDSAILGEMPPGYCLVGEGQKMTSTIIDLLIKVDSRLKVSYLRPDCANSQKHYVSLVSYGDQIARKVLDDELEALTNSLGGGPNVRYSPNFAWTEALG